MCWYEVELKPRDVLFFRDAKPMEASSVGQGARWPWPNILHDSFISAFQHKWPDRQDWEFEHKNRNKKDKNWDTSSMRFGGLRSIGVFPTLNDEVCFHKPADISKNGKDIAVLEKIEGESNLPGFLEYIVVNHGKPEKESAGEWISASEMNAYLNGTLPKALIKTSEVYDAESRFGIAIDPETGTADKGDDNESGKVYIAEYMRLKENAGIKGFISCSSSLRGEEKADVVKEFFHDGRNEHIIFGGQRGVAMVDAVREEQPLPFTNNKCSKALLIKWVLLTPALFTKGWKPGWIDSDGQVKLQKGKLLREEGESRIDWRKRCHTAGNTINAKLVAARVDKPLPISGWSLRLADSVGLTKGGPRASRLAVPAGSVYYFRADSEEDARALVGSLQGHCKSNYYGEKGFGFGVCAPVIEENIKEIE